MGRGLLELTTHMSRLIDSAPTLCLSRQDVFTLVPFLAWLSRPSTCILLETLHFLVARGRGRLCETAWQLVLEHAAKYSFPITRPVGSTDVLQFPFDSYKEDGVMQ